jgi:hypothetical protein
MNANPATKLALKIYKWIGLIVGQHPEGSCLTVQRVMLRLLRVGPGPDPPLPFPAKMGLRSYQGDFFGTISLGLSLIHANANLICLGRWNNRSLMLSVLATHLPSQVGKNNNNPK